jgi:hypothetical protein
MAKIDAFSGLYSLNARGKFSSPNGLGIHKLGWTQLGHHDKKAGYYQRHWNGIKYNWVRAKPYWPKQNWTEKHLARAQIFREGVQAWHALDSQTKQAYNDLKYPSAQTGFTRFMTQYLKSH